MAFLQQFKTGAALPFTGWRFIKQNSPLWKWLWIPWLINLSLLVTGWFFGVVLVMEWVTAAVAAFLVPGTFLYGLLLYPLMIILGLGFVLVWIFVILAVSTAVSGPFNSILAEKCLKLRGQQIQMPSFWHLIRASLLKAIFLAGLGCMVFVCSFIPGVNVVAAMVSLFLLAADIYDYVGEAQGFSLAKRLTIIRERFALLLGLAMALSLTLFIPGLTVLLLPVTVAGASYNETRKDSSGDS